MLGGPTRALGNMTDLNGTVVIVGASHAAVQAIDTLRREGMRSGL